MAGLIPFMAATPAAAVSEPQVVATGLNNPYKLTFGPDGHLYVAEAGTGGTTNCVESEDPESEESVTFCLGATGSVTRVTSGTGAQSRPVTGLPSIAEKESGGDGAGGASAVSVGSDGTIDVIIGLGGGQEDRAAFGTAGAGLGTIMRAAPGQATATVFSDLLAFEAANDPDKAYGELSEGIDSNPFDLKRTADNRLLAVDAGGNTLLEIGPTGTPSLVTLFPLGEPAELPPFIPAPPGTKIPPQPVPTSVEQAPGGGIFVGELTGFPFPVGKSRIHSVTGNSNSAAHTGFTQVTDIAFDAAGNLYVLELFANGIFSGSDHSQVVQVRADGSRKVILSAELEAPGGITIGPDGFLYVTNHLDAAGEGEVIRVDPRVARDTAIADACDPTKVKGSGFRDVTRSVHQEAVECLRWWGLVNGLSATTFGINRTTTRGEVASVLARLLERAGVQLAANPPKRFSDTQDGTHALRINQLADKGIVNGFGDGTFRPNRPITRAEVASLLVRGFKAATGQDLPAGTNSFDDDNGNTHEANIDAAAAAGWIRGTAARQFSPNNLTQRGQLASFSARMLSTLVKRANPAITLPT